MLRQLPEQHELIWALTLTKLKISYNRAPLGILGTVSNHVLQMVVLRIILLVVPRIAVSGSPLFLSGGLFLRTFFPLGLAA